jgi:demethylmenaquinone methyltransferase/2-methoxy-6-polyprenyl-1,4-benzoquinol methylase
MLEIAQKRIDEAGLSQQVELREMGVAELGGETPESYDVVMSGLCFSELSDNELHYTLRETYRILKPGGLILFAVETIPHSIHKKLLHWLIKVPLIVITYVVTQATTRAVKHLPEKVEDAGFLIDAIRRSPLESFIELRGRKPKGGTARVLANTTSSTLLKHYCA